MAFKTQLFDTNKTIYPAFPGAYILNGTAVLTTNWQMFPIYKNITNYSSIGISSQDNAYYVLPQYKVVVYPSNDYSGTPETFDNSGSTFYLFTKTTIDNGNSCKLYYKNTELS